MATTKRKIKLIKNILGSVLSIAMLSSIIFYLLQVNVLASQSYQVQDLENKIKKLQEQNNKLEITNIELKSMQHVTDLVQDLGMTQVKQIAYLSISEKTVRK